MTSGDRSRVTSDVKALAVAAARVAEARIRTSPRLRKAGRRAMALLARVSPEARAFVRLRLMRLV